MRIYLFKYVLKAALKPEWLNVLLLKNYDCIETYIIDSVRVCLFYLCDWNKNRMT